MLNSFCQKTMHSEVSSLTGSLRNENVMPILWTKWIPKFSPRGRHCGLFQQDMDHPAQVFSWSFHLLFLWPELAATILWFNDYLLFLWKSQFQANKHTTIQTMKTEIESCANKLHWHLNKAIIKNFVRRVLLYHQRPGGQILNLFLHK